jgi:hypothetical protein
MGDFRRGRKPAMIVASETPQRATQISMSNEKTFIVKYKAYASLPVCFGRMESGFDS